MHVTAAAWAVTLALIAGLLALDWLLLGRRPHAVGFREALRWSLFYIAVALLFGVGFGLIAGWDLGTQYFAGYVVEKSLSVDNLFVFVIIISAFAVPAEQQPKALTIGIAIALALRAVFIALGAALLATFSFMFLIFGLTLVATAVQLYRHRNQDPTVEDNALVAAARRLLPISDSYDEGRIITRLDGRRVFTPLLLALLAIGSYRPPVRVRLDPRRLRRHRSRLHRLRRQRVRAARPARPVLPRLRPARPARLPLDRPGRDPGVHRRQADARIRPPPESLDPRDPHRTLARRDRRGARRDHHRQPDQGPTRPEHPCPRRSIAPTPPGDRNNPPPWTRYRAP